MKKYVIIVAGGRGSRMGTEIPKQFLILAGKPLLMHTIERFTNYENSIAIITVLPSDQIKYWDFLQKEYSFCIPQTVVAGGESRFYSVRNGLNLVTGDGLIAVHDGVRPLVSTATIERCFETAGRLGNAIPVISSNDSLRIISAGSSLPVDRQDIKIVQTPQVFRADLIRKAYMLDYEPGFTDDATVLERSGEKINLVGGNSENIKITNPQDLVVSAALLSTVS